MQPAPTRFSHRHLLALSTFLVPLAILAVLGWNELQRSGASAQAALVREGQEFVKRARQAVEQRLDQLVPRLLDRARLELEKETTARSTVRATLRLAAEPEFAALRSIVLLDEQGGVKWPALEFYSTYLPLLLQTQRGAESLGEDLAKAGVLLANDRRQEAIALLRDVLRRLEIANPPGPDRNGQLLELEAVARLRLASTLLADRQRDAAREQFTLVVKLAASSRRSMELAADGFLAEAELARMGTAQERLNLLREIADNQREILADGLLTAVAHRLAATFAADDPARPVVDELLREEACRAAIRSFATDYEHVVKWWVVMRRQRSASTAESPADEEGEDERLVLTIDGRRTALVCIRPATPAIARNYGCASLAVHLDLRALLATTWAQFADEGNTFALAVQDLDGTAIVPPPPTTLPDFYVPTETTNDLTLSAYVADPARLSAEAEASATKRTLLIMALFVTALGGALWSWRSVSREAELAALKIDLVSRVSHELKTPLALVRMYGETLSMGRARDSNQAAEFGAIIAREAERLTALIQRILDFSRQQAGTLTYTAAPIDLAELLRSVVEAYSPHLASRGAFLVDSLPHGIQVHCDPNALESAIVNLLENAAKYGRDGDEEHEIDLVLQRQGDKAVIEVRDHGRGIPPAELGRIFDGFYRASNAGEVRGAGLGLSLVRHFARAHGGEIQALPRDGGGTVMRLTLPLAAAPAAVPAAEPSTGSTAAGPHPAPDP